MKYIISIAIVILFSVNCYSATYNYFGFDDPNAMIGQNFLVDGKVYRFDSLNGESHGDDFVDVNYFFLVALPEFVKPAYLSLNPTVICSNSITSSSFDSALNAVSYTNSWCCFNATEVPSSDGFYYAAESLSIFLSNFLGEFPAAMPYAPNFVTSQSLANSQRAAQFSMLIDNNLDDLSAKVAKMEPQVITQSISFLIGAFISIAFVVAFRRH